MHIFDTLTIYDKAISECGSLMDMQGIVKRKQRRRHDRLSSATIYVSPSTSTFVLDLCRAWQRQSPK